MKFAEECTMCAEKHVLVPKILYKWAKHKFAPMSLRSSMIRKYTDYSVKKKFWVQWSIKKKKGHVDNVLE